MIETYTTRNEWLRARRSRIGGSDAPKILGVSRYGGRVSTWAEKLGLAGDDMPRVPGTPMDFGLRFERPIAEAWCELHDAELEPSLAPAGGFASVALDDVPFFGSTPDFFVRHQGARKLMQVKNVDVGHAGEWKDGAPLEHEIQLQHELASCASLPEPPVAGILAACIGGNRLVAYEREFDVGFFEFWLPQAAEFWRCVETKTAPRIDGSEESRRAALAIHRGERSGVVELADPRFAALWNEHREIAPLVRSLKERKAEIETDIVLALGKATRAEIPGAGVFAVISVQKDETIQRASVYDYVRSLPFPKRKKGT
jgi:predicted phage-related endonuclease